MEARVLVIAVCVTNSKATRPGHGTSEPSPVWATGSARRSSLVNRMARGERGADLVSERDGQQSLLQRGTRLRQRGHEEPALEYTTAFHQQFRVGAHR